MNPAEHVLEELRQRVPTFGVAIMMNAGPGSAHAPPTASFCGSGHLALRRPRAPLGLPAPRPGSRRHGRHRPESQYLPGETFLRGRQLTYAAGAVEFRTIYPGWYPGRTVHIHTIVHAASMTFTSQLYFPDPTSDEVLATGPYGDRPGRDTTNDTDTIFATGGIPAVLDITRSASGYRAVICLVLPSPTELR